LRLALISDIVDRCVQPTSHRDTLNVHMINMALASETTIPVICCADTANDIVGTK